MPDDNKISRSWVYRLLEPPVVLSVVGVLGLAVIWGVTTHLTANQREAASFSARTLTTDMADTYEAQVVRALREIDHTLKLVRYKIGSSSAQSGLRELESKGLLPPKLVFRVSIANADGDIIATTRPASMNNLARFDFFEHARRQDNMVVSEPLHDPDIAEWRLHFARRFTNPKDQFAGIVMVSVHNGYFVSSYDSNVLGTEGVVGLVGTDGIFRARRTGDVVSGGTEINYTDLIPNDDIAETNVSLDVNSWDKTARYTIARKLFGFPLAIIVGISRSEQLAPVRELERTYMIRAGIASALLIAVVVLLGRLSWQLQSERMRVADERLEHAQRVEHLAYHDDLTQLPNRASFSKLLSEKLRDLTEDDMRLALLFIDLDRFKTVNDSLGHDAGDELLQHMGRRLYQSAGGGHFVARLGGDEFVVMLSGIDANTQIGSIADNVLSIIGKPTMVEGQQVRVTASMGITVFPDDGKEEQQLIKNADMAMYHAKSQGKNNFQFYSDDLHANTLERLALETGLRHALERNEFRLVYQAKRDLRTDALSGVEALLRWENPDMGTVSPTQFVPLAEETGLIVSIGRWVLKAACEQSVAWQETGFPVCPMAVNLSPRQFSDENLLEDITDTLEDTGMDPQLLELEITETTIMQDVDRASQILGDLKAMGVKVAVDDFGTGYSSLATLKQLPVDTIKIDKSFLAEVARSAEDKALVASIISLGKSLGLTIVAEGVETADQTWFLRAQGCDQYQGFYINRSMPAEEFTQLINGDRRTHVVP